MTGVVSRREQIRNDAITPVVILREHASTQGKRSKKRQKDQDNNAVKTDFRYNIRAKSYAFATRVLPLGTLTINTIDRDVCHPWLG
jgi:hypothetical protein